MVRTTHSIVNTVTRPSSLPMCSVFSSLDMVKLRILLSMFNLYTIFKLRHTHVRFGMLAREIRRKEIGAC